MATIRAVVLDAMGVIYRARDDVVELLIPFARSHGCNLPEDEINRHYIRCSLGECSSAELWRALDVPGSDGSPAHGDYPSAGSFAEVTEWVDRMYRLEGNE